MPTVRYTCIQGEVITEKRNGVRSLYVPDPLGSTVALLDNTQTQTDQWSYMPYGESTRIKGTNPTPFLFVGTQGYRTDSSSRIYDRARFVDPPKGRWLTADATWDDNSLYTYCFNDPITYVDPLGDYPDWTPKWMQPGHESRNEALNCLKAAIKNNKDCQKIGAGVAKLYAIMRCIMGCETRNAPSKDNPFLPDYGPMKHGKHTVLPADQAGLGPCRIVGDNWKAQTGANPGWDKKYCPNIKAGVAIMCMGGKLTLWPWNTISDPVDKAKCFDKCMAATYNPAKRTGTTVT